MNEVLRTTATIYEKRTVDGTRRIEDFRGDPNHEFCKMLKRVNITLSKVTHKDDVRYALVSRLFGRTITSTYQLTVGEARAFLRLSNVNPQFTSHLAQLKEIIEDEPATEIRRIRGFRGDP